MPHRQRSSIARKKVKKRPYSSLQQVNENINSRPTAQLVQKSGPRLSKKVIFRTHNEGNSVKIRLPIQNVLEIEESSILDFADTVKVRVIDNDETFAIDEVGNSKRAGLQG